MDLLGFRQAAKLSVTTENGTSVTARLNGKEETMLAYGPHEPIRGNVHLAVNGNKNLEHTGVRIELIGQIEMLIDRSSTFEFTSLVRELAEPGEIAASADYPFEFTEVEKPYESYDGIHVRLRYFLRVSITRSYGSKLVHEHNFRVYTNQPATEAEAPTKPVQMGVGIEDCLDIEFEYNSNKYHLHDVVLGKIFFLLVRIRIKHMELAIIKRETVGTGATAIHENPTIAKFEIMDGAPVRGDAIPIRLFLGGIDSLTPTFDNVMNKFSVRYFLNLVLIDEEDRRYFKQQEVTFYRKEAEAKAA